MIPRRIWVNLAAFFALFALLCAWALDNVLHLDAIEQPYRVVASFESSPGLRRNVEVTYHGVQVGSVEQVRLSDARVDVHLDIDRGRELPRGLTAAVRRKSAVGEPYVALDPPEGYGGGGPYIEPGERYRIDVGSTSVPLAYGELFTAFDELVRAVPRDDLVTVIDELATALGGRGDELRSIVHGTSEVTGTLADRAETLDALAIELTSLTHTISEKRDAIGSSFDDLASLTETLAAASGEVDTLLSTAPAFGDQVAALLAQITDDLGCTFADTGALFGKIGTPQHIAEILAALEFAGDATEALNRALVHPGEGGADGYYLGGSFIPEVEDPPPAYDSPLQLPAPPTLQACAASAAGDDHSLDSAVPDGGEAAAGRGDETSSPEDEAAAPVPRHEVSSDKDVAASGDPWLWLLAGLAALGAVTIGAMRAWQLLRPDGDDA